MNILLARHPEPDEIVQHEIERSKSLRFVSFGDKDDGVVSVFPSAICFDVHSRIIKDLTHGLSFTGAGSIILPQGSGMKIPIVRWEALPSLFPDTTTLEDSDYKHSVEQELRERMRLLLGKN